MLARSSPVPEPSWPRHSRTSIYELSSEDSLIGQPAPLPKVARKSQDEMDELFRHDAVMLGKEESNRPERRPPQIMVHLADGPRAPESIRKPRRLRKVEKVTSLRELKLVRSLEGR
jgi:hypothetical protein